MSINYRPLFSEEPLNPLQIPVRFTYINSNQPSKNNRHYHLNFEFLYLLKGKLVLTTEYGQQLLTPQKIVIVPPFLEHNVKAIEYGPYEYLLIEIQNYNLSFPDSRQADGTTSLCDDNLLLHPTIKQIVSELTNTHLFKDEILQSFFNVLTCHLIASPSASETTQMNHLQPGIQLCKNYIDHYFCDDIPLFLLSEKSQLSVYHLSRTFKQQVGLTPLQYITHVRVDHAKQILKQTNTSIQQIAEESGFKNSTYFSRVFKVTTGLTPTHYRKKTHSIRVESDSISNRSN